EGAQETGLVNKYVRNPEARAKCIEIYGTRSCVCGLRFEHMYGSFAKDFSHVQHLKPLHTIGDEYEVDPKEDVRQVGPNCHAMLHKTENRIPMTIQRLKLLYSVSLSNPLRQTFEE